MTAHRSTPTAALTRGGGTAAGRLPPSGNPCLRNAVVASVGLWLAIIAVLA